MKKMSKNSAITDEFVSGEMLAEGYIERVSLSKQLLEQGRTSESMKLLTDVEESMEITLAIGEKQLDGVIIH